MRARRVGRGGEMGPANDFPDAPRGASHSHPSASRLFLLLLLLLPFVWRSSPLSPGARLRMLFEGFEVRPASLFLPAPSTAAGKRKEARGREGFTPPGLQTSPPSPLLPLLLQSPGDDSPPPSLFVLMGDFSSKPHGGGGGAGAALGPLKASFEALGVLISEFPKISSASQFAFVPGPGDPSLSAPGTLPRPALPSSLTRGLRRLVSP